jgi:hypothetical protein
MQLLSKLKVMVTGVDEGGNEFKQEFTFPDTYPDKAVLMWTREVKYYSDPWIDGQIAVRWRTGSRLDITVDQNHAPVRI